MSGFKDFDQDTPGNNASIGAINFAEGQLPSTVNDSNRQFAADLRKGIAGSEFSANSATTVDLSQIESNNIKIAGTTQIENLGVQSAGIEKNLRFTDALTIKHSAGAIVCPGLANLSVITADVVTVRAEGSGAWRVINYQTATNNSGQYAFPAAQNPSADANTLDDYEEGTWQPGITFSVAGNTSVNFSVTAGIYTKIGDAVTAIFRFETSTFTHTTADGELHITGLPFTVSGVTNAFPVGALTMSGWSVAGITSVNCVGIGNETYMRVYGQGSSQNIRILEHTDVPTGNTVIGYGSITYKV
jgi:hypothetical protein